MPNLTLLAVFVCAVMWSIVFSFFNSPRIRAFRNFGILACYLSGLIGPVFVGFVPSVTAWLVMGVLGGLVYYLWQFWSYIAVGRHEGDLLPTPIALIHGLVLWPIMIPEAVEYAGAEVGVLKPAKIDKQESK